jgi:hypothetical protein
MGNIVYTGPACTGRNMLMGEVRITGNGAQGGVWGVPEAAAARFEQLPFIALALTDGTLRRVTVDYRAQTTPVLEPTMRIDAPELSDYPDTLTLDQFKGMADLFGLSDSQFKAVRLAGVAGSGRNGTARNSPWFFPKDAALGAIQAYLLAGGD